MGYGSSTPGGTNEGFGGSDRGFGGGRGGDNLSVNDLIDPNFFNSNFNPGNAAQGFMAAGPLGLAAGIEPFNDQGQMTPGDWGMVREGAIGNPSGGGDGQGVNFGTGGTAMATSNVDPNSRSALIQQMIDANRVNQTTPFGGTTWGDDGVESYLSPELQSLFTKQFTPGAYDQYGDDYMANARRLLEPVYDRQTENFQQTMANRGQPVGGELYDDTYGNLMDAQNRGWESAAFGATQAGETARNTDFNRLMSAMGHSNMPVPQTDVLGAANLGLNAQNMENQRDQQKSDNMWNTLASLGSAYIGSKPDWLFG